MTKIKKSIKINSYSKKQLLIKKILPIFGLSTLFIVPSTIVLTSSLNQEFIKNNSLNKNKQISENLSVTIDNPDASAFQNDIKPLVPSYVNYVNRLISTKMGPIVHYKNILVSLDWFGAERWKIDTTNYAPNKGNNLDKTWDRAWLNIALDRKNNHIWMLTNGSTSGSPYKQKLIQINVLNGEVVSQNELPQANKIFFNIVFLESGKVMVFDDRDTTRFTPKYVLFDPLSSNFETKTGNIGNDSMVTKPDGFPNSYMFFANVIPIDKNRNIVMVINFPRPSSGDDGATTGTSNIYFILADDNLNKVTTTGYWSKGQLAVNGLKGYRNSKIWPQMDYYKLLDGRTVAMIYNSLVVIDPNNNSIDKENNISFKTYSVGNDWITSWSFDTRERLYFKLKNDTKIYQIMKVPSLEESTAIVSDYYDLNSSPIESVKQNAKSFIIYAVHGYSGALMLINSHFSELIGPSVWPSQEESDKKLYGLALGIVPNQSNPDFGDTKGLLNTDKAFQFSADFTIDKSVLEKKLPSEITQDDLTFLNESFLTKNVDKNENGLLYPPFIKSGTNDQTKQFTIQVYLDQIPWFTNKLPLDAIPLKVTRTFNTTHDINSRIKWKDVSEDYDFKNTLPTKVDETDLKRFNPFLIDLTSQKVMQNTTQLYPKKEYKVTQRDDTNGKITIECDYTYMPLGVAIDANNELKYTFSQDFTIFKSTDQKVFKWNTDNSNSTNSISNINNIPSLKKFTEANVLPSSIQTNNQSQLLEFIDLNGSSGYPISKMKQNVSPNDKTGSLSLSLTLPQDYYNQGEQTFNHTYTNLNKLGDYSFTYKTPNKVNSLLQTNYSKLLPSQVTEEQIFSDFISYSGYDGLDLVTTLLPNDNNGTLKVEVELTNNYPVSVASMSPFQFLNGKYIASKTFSNFLTQKQFQQQYVLQFKNNNDSSLTEIKNMEVNTILNAIKSVDGLTIGNKTYKSEAELVNLFILSKGISIPNIQQKNVNVYPDNQSGILTFELVFLESETGLSYPLSFTQTFTGFLQGVAVPTQDIFIFKNQGVLGKDILDKNPSTIAQELEKNPALIENYFVANLGGQFKELIKNPTHYTITTFPNDLNGTLGITIKFTGITNPQTLPLYSKMYSGFKIVS